jgi:outer membrane immunogenic protein
MKSLEFAAVASVALFPTSVAFAQSPVLYNWTGFYAGVSVGTGWQGGNTSWSPTGPCAGLVCFAPGVGGFAPYDTSVGANPASNGWQLGSTNGSGGTFGANIGYNLQFTPNFVVGVEGAFNTLRRPGSSFHTNSQDFGGGNSRTDFFTAGGGVDALGTLMGRAGFTIGRAMFYTKAGLAIGRVRMNTSATSTMTSVFGGGYGYGGTTTTSAVWNGKQSTTRAGLALGGGAEFALTNNLSVRLDTTWFDLGKANVFAPGSATTVSTGKGGFNGSGPAQPYTVSRRLTGTIIQFGLNYHF